jgi:hypothetical protein
MVECVICKKLLDEATVQIFGTPNGDEYFVCGSAACEKEAVERYV